MILTTPAKKAAFALTLVAPLVLTACGNGEEETTETTSTVTSTSAASSEEETTSEETTSEEPTTSEAESDADEPAAAAAAQDGEAGARETLVNPFEGGADPFQGEAVEPLNTGGEADEATKQELTNLVGGIYQTTTLREFMQYIPKNTCASLLAEQEQDPRAVDYNQVPNIPMDSMEGVNWSQTNLQSLDNVRVDGDTASAHVSVSTASGVDESDMRFQRENGKWTFCR